MAVVIGVHGFPAIGIPDPYQIMGLVILLMRLISVRLGLTDQAAVVIIHTRSPVSIPAGLSYPMVLVGILIGNTGSIAVNNPCDQ